MYSEIFENKNFLKLWSAQIFSQVGIHSLYFATIVSVYSLTSSNQAVALIVISYGLASFLFGTPAGVISDHFNRKSIMFWSLIGRFLLGIILIFLNNTLLGPILVVFVLNSIAQFFFPCEGSSIPVLVKEKHLVIANSISMSTNYLAQIVGYILPGIMISVYGFTLSVFVLSCLFLLASIFIRLIEYPLDNREHVKNRIKIKQLLYQLSDNFVDSIISIGSEFKKGFLLVIKRQNVRENFLYLCLLQITIGSISSLLPGLADSILSVDVKRAGLFLVSPVVLGLLVGTNLLSRNNGRLKDGRIINIGIYMAVVALFAVSCIRLIIDYTGVEIYKYMSLVFMFFVGMANSLVFITSNSGLQKDVEKNLLGRVYGLLQSTVSVLGVLPVVFISIIADTMGVDKAFGFMSVLILIIHLLYRRLCASEV